MDHILSAQRTGEDGATPRLLEQGDDCPMAATHRNILCSALKTVDDLVSRQRRYTGKKLNPYKCTSCFKTFTTKSTLTVHTRTHKPFRKFRCEMCNKSFQSMGCLTTHLVRHTAVTPMSQADGSCELETQVQKLESKLGELCTQFKTLREDVSQLKSEKQKKCTEKNPDPLTQGRLATIQRDPVEEKVPESRRVSSPTYESPGGSAYHSNA